MEGKETGNSQAGKTNFWLTDGELRLVWKLTSFVAVFSFSLLLLSVILYLLPIGDYVRYAYAASFLGAGLIATAFALKGIELKSMLDVGLHRPSMFAGALVGNGYGAALVGLAVVIMYAGQYVYLEPSKVTFEGAARVLANGLVFFFLVAASEELLMRGYPFQMLYKRFGAPVALVVTSAFFTLLHLANPNITILSISNIFLAGMLLGSAYLATGSLWFPIGLHMGWNLVQGTVFGFPVSGIITGSVFVAVPLGVDEVSGGLFGLEGSIIASVVLLFGTVTLWIPPVRKKLPGNPAPRSGVSQVALVTQEQNT